MEEKKNLSAKDIFNLWDWFEEAQPEILATLERGTAEDQKALGNDLDEKILALGLFTWDIEKSETDKYVLTISPNRDAQLLEISKNIVQQAPTLDFWEFRFAKSKLKEVSGFKVFDINQDPHMIYPASWLSKIENGTLYIYAKNLKAELDQETLEYTLDLIATAFLGEEYRIMEIGKIIRVAESDESYSPITDPR